MTDTRLGIVIIGRNEGERLRHCLASVIPLGAPVVYVDSGSTDGSPALAQRMGATVVPLAAAAGFTAARGRNAGLAALSAGGSPPAYVQFIDGDCRLVDGWIDTAVAHLDTHPDCAVVAGRRRELFPEASIFNRLCDMEWNTPVGPAAAVGGDALYRRMAFVAAGGFTDRLICGEEPELCLRLRRLGWRIERLDHAMTLHDAAMTRWGQWFRRSMRGGWAFAEGAALHGRDAERYNRRAVRSILFWGAAVPAGALAALAIGFSLGGWPGGLAIALGVVALYVAMVLRVARNRRHTGGEAWPAVLLYGGMTMLGKGAELVGMTSYALSSLNKNNNTVIIEYK